MNDDTLVSRLAPVTDEQAAALVSPRALGELGEEIMLTAPGRSRSGRRDPLGWRAVTASLSAAAAVAVVIALIFSVGGQHGGPRPGAGRARLAALVFTSAPGYIDVVIRDPYADPATYRAEFAAHHLNISLTMVPGSPSVVGTLAMGGGNGLTVLRQPGRCTEPGGGACAIGVRIPAGFRGSAQLAFVGPARPGEKYESTGQVTAPGEAMHGLRYLRRRVSAVLAMLARRHVTVGAYRVITATGFAASPRSVPADWYVTGADPYAPGEVMLWASRTPHGGPSAKPPACRTGPGVICPSPTAAPSPAPTR
jgi:hypothetical protein